MEIACCRLKHVATLSAFVLALHCSQSYVKHYTLYWWEILFACVSESVQRALLASLVVAVFLVVQWEAQDDAVHPGALCDVVAPALKELLRANLGVLGGPGPQSKYLLGILFSALTASFLYLKIISFFLFLIPHPQKFLCSTAIETWEAYTFKILLSSFFLIKLSKILL